MDVANETGASRSLEFSIVMFIIGLQSEVVGGKGHLEYAPSQLLQVSF